MRKITQEIIQVFFNFQTNTIGNSSAKNGKLYLHGNLIAKIEENNLYITNAGWFSNTTKDRLNGLPGVSIYQKKGDWYLNGQKWDGKWINVGKLPSKDGSC